jgi:hypothetical protein
MMLVTKDENVQVPVLFKHDEPHNAVIMVPTLPLKANTSYVVLVLGLTFNNVNDTINDNTVVRSIGGSPLLESYSWEFQTSDVFDSTIPDDINMLVVDLTTGDILGATGTNWDTSIDYSSLNAEPVTKVGYLSVLKIDPIDFQIDVPVNTGYIDIFLNDKLAEKHRNFLNAANSPIGTAWMVDDQNYLKSFITVKAYNAGGFNQYTIFQPTFTIDYNDSTDGVVLIRISFGSKMRSHNKSNTSVLKLGRLEYNATYVITLRAGLSGVNTRDMEKNFQSGFTTILYPKYSEPDAIGFELGDIANHIPTDTINKALYRYSVLASIKFNDSKIYPNPVPYYVVSWVECSATLALIKGILGSRALLADQRKTLDIFTIQYGAWGPVHHLAGAVDDLKECILKNAELCANVGAKTGLTYGRRANEAEGRPGVPWSYSRTDKYSDRHVNDSRGNDSYWVYGKYPNMRRRSTDKRFRRS